MSRLIVLPEMPSSEDITSDGWVESQNISSDFARTIGFTSFCQTATTNNDHDAVETSPNCPLRKSNQALG